MLITLHETLKKMLGFLKNILHSDFYFFIFPVSESDMPFLID